MGGNSRKQKSCKGARKKKFSFRVSFSFVVVVVVLFCFLVNSLVFTGALLILEVS